jgi:hypothetical protein
VTPQVISAPRNSDYYGGTISYSYGQAWYVDLSYAHGDSSGNFTLPQGGGNATFTLKDEWYQAYVRYTFPSLRGKRLSAYLRAGGSYVTADQTPVSTVPPLEYRQNNHAKDILGNIGFGVGYRLNHGGGPFRIWAQAEGEGFYGERSQDSQESLLNAGEVAPTVNIHNTLYGGIARGTLRFEYRLGASGLLRVFAEGGVEAKYTLIDYPGSGSSNELLWGPYAKVGFRYSF